MKYQKLWFTMGRGAGWEISKEKNYNKLKFIRIFIEISEKLWFTMGWEISKEKLLKTTITRSFTNCIVSRIGRELFCTKPCLILSECLLWWRSKYTESSSAFVQKESLYMKVSKRGPTVKRAFLNDIAWLGGGDLKPCQMPIRGKIISHDKMSEQYWNHPDIIKYWNHLDSLKMFGQYLNRPDSIEMVRTVLKLSGHYWNRQ